MRIPALCALISALSLSFSLAWSQAETGAIETTTAPVEQNKQETASDMPCKPKGMMKGHPGMGGHGVKHGGKGRGKRHDMKHGHHQDVLRRLDRMEKRQILIETMLRELLLEE